MATKITTRSSHLVECGICYEMYTMEERVPKGLPCGHTFCNICLENRQTEGRVCCQNCKEIHEVPKKGIQGFMTNMTIISMLDITCSRCHNVGPTSRCPHCPVQFCLTCMNDHVQSEYKPAVKVLLTKLLTSKRRLRKELPIFVDKINTLILNVEEFCSKSEEAIQAQVNPDILNQMEEKVQQFVTAMDEVGEHINREYCVNPDLPCFTDMKTLTYRNTPRVIFGTRGHEPGQLKQPVAAVVDEQSGNIHVADQDKKRICVFDKVSGYKSSYKVDGTPSDLCSTADGGVAIACRENKVIVCDVSGLVSHTIALSIPDGICKDNEDLLYVGQPEDNKIEVFDKSGSAIRVLNTITAGSGSGAFYRWSHHPWSLAIHPQTDKIYAADTENKMLNIFSHDGRNESSMCEANIPGSVRLYPRYISFRSDGVLCISDTINHCVYLLRDGRVIQKIGEKGSDPGQFLQPCGTAFTSSGELIVCDTGNNRVQVFF